MDCAELCAYYASPEIKLRNAIEQADVKAVKALLKESQCVANEPHELFRWSDNEKSITYLKIVPLLYVAHCYDALRKGKRQQLKDAYFQIAKLLMQKTDLQKVATQMTHEDGQFGYKDFQSYSLDQVKSHRRFCPFVALSNFERRFLKEVASHGRN